MAGKWRRVMAVGCSHGDLVHPAIRQQVLDFKKRFKPEVRFELGDMLDTACFRNGSAGTKDEARSPRDDENSAHRWLDEYEPTHICYGNHDVRVLELSTHPKAIVAELAGRIWNGLEDKARKLKAKTVPYDIQHGWHYVGGVAWGHGFMYNMQAVRDHAEMVGCPVVMAHLHAPQQVEGRTIRSTPSFCVGAMADDEKLGYGRRRRNSLTHGHGIVWGEVSETDAHLWLIRSENGKPLVFPPVNIWDVLAEALDDAPKVRPEDSVTAQEFAERSGFSPSCAASKLADMAKAGKLRAVRYKTESGAAGKCYVVAE